VFFPVLDPQLIKLGETALIPIYSPYYTSANKGIAAYSISGVLAKNWKTIFADLTNLRSKFIFLEFLRCTRIQLMMLENPPPIKHQWVRGDTGDHAISGSKCLESVLMCIVVIGTPTLGTQVSEGELYVQFIYLGICPLSLARENEEEMNI